MQSNRVASISNNTMRKDSVRKGSLPQKNKKQIPRVQIFLDQHLTKAIGQIRQQKVTFKLINNINNNNDNLLLRHKRRSTYEQQDTMEQSYKGKNSMMMIIDDNLDDRQSSNRVSPSLNTNNGSTQRINQKAKNKIELMPNDVVLQYVHEVYQKYGIENPFEGYLDDVANQKQSKDNSAIIVKEQLQQKRQKNWHSFSQRKDRSTINEQIKINDNYFIRQHVNQYENEDDRQEFSTINNNNTVRTQKKTTKKLSQNQQKILQLKNKFKQIDQLTSTNHRKQLTSPQPIRPIAIGKTNPHKPTTSYHIKQSSDNITYIDNLKNLMESQFTQFDTSIKNISFQNEKDKVSMKFIDSMGQILYDDTQVKINDNYMSSPHQLQSAIKPKKKLFVKTKGTSTKYNSVQATPMGQSGRKVRFDQFLQSQNKQQLTNQNNKLFLINQKIYQQSTVNNSMISQPMAMKQSLSSSLTNSGIYIPQYHRYCLGCEQPILDSNILFHQQNCDQLKKISNSSLNELITLVNEKLSHLKSQLGQSQLFNLKIDDIDEIKSLGKIMLNEQFAQKDKNEGKKLKVQKQNLCKIDRLLQKKVLKGCEIIKKIQWFMKLKITMQIQLSSQESKKQFLKQENNISIFTLK